MLTFTVELENESVTVALPVEHWDSYAKIMVTPANETTEKFASWLSRQTGARGHLIGRKSTGADVWAALNRRRGKFRQLQANPPASVYREHPAGVS